MATSGMDMQHLGQLVFSHQDHSNTASPLNNAGPVNIHETSKDDLHRIPEISLEQGLAAAPFVCLVPTQLIAPLLASINIDTVTSETDIVDRNPNSMFNQFKDVINQLPTQHTDIIEEIVNEFIAYEDSELDDLQFKGMSLCGDNSLKPQIDLLPLESEIFEKMVDVAIPSNTMERKIPRERLVIHDEMEGIVTTIDDSLKIEKVDTTNDIFIESNISKIEKSDDQSPNLKRRFDEIDTSGFDITIEESVKKLTFLETDELTERAMEELISLVQKLSSDDVTMWTPLDGRSILSTTWLMSLLDKLYRIMNKPMFQNFPLEHLQKIQSVCFANISEVLDLTNTHSKSPHFLDIAFNSLMASRNILFILQTRSDKQLFVDEYLRAVIDLTYNLTEVVSEDIVTFGSLVSDVGLNLSILSEYILHNNVDEQILTRLEYLSIHAIYSTLSKLGNHLAMESLRFNASTLLCTIFKQHPDQRHFILEEVLSNFTTTTTSIRQYKLYRGASIHMVSALLLNLIQSFDLSKFSKASQECISGDLIEKSSKRKNLNEDLLQLQNQAVTTANDIASVLVTKLSKNPDQAHKTSMEGLLEDLLYVLPFPEWPASETLLSSIMRSFMRAVETSGSYPAIVETYVLEMAGSIAIKILMLRKHEEDGNIFDEFALPTLEYVQIQVNKNKFFAPAFRFLLLKYFCQLLPILENRNENDIGTGLEALGSELDDSQIGINPTSVYEVLLDILANDAIVLNHSIEDYDSINLYGQILLKQDLFQQYDGFIRILVQSLDSSKVKSRSRALKILSSLVDIDRSLLMSSAIKESFINKFSDSSPMVRDSVIDLVSKYMGTNRDIIQQFYQPICERMADSSIQVRKRVIKLAKEMYMNSGDCLIQANISVQMLKRLDDEEEVIVEMVKSYLLELWFSKGNNVPVIIEVISNGNSKELFERFVEFVSDKFKLKQMIETALDKVVDGFDLNILEKCMMLISTLVKCDGKLMSQDQLVALQPYLVDEKTNGQPIMLYILQTLKFVVKELSVLRKDLLISIETSLLRRLTKFNARELSEAMPCIWRISLMNGSTVKIANASIMCLNHIRPFISKAKREGWLKSDPKLRKLLHLIESFGAYCLFEENRKMFLQANVGLKQNETVVSLITKVLLFFCSTQGMDPVLRMTSIKNILGICASHPTLYTSEAILKVLDREFEAGNIDTKVVIIQGIIEFLEKEDLETKKRNGVLAKLSKDVKLDVAVFHGHKTKTYVNDGICTAIIQRYIRSILPLCFYDEGNLSIIPIQYLQHVVKLGYANPKICIPLIIALESTSNRYVKLIAMSMHQELVERHESLTGSSYVEAIKIATQFRLHCLNGNNVRLSKERFFLKNIYSIVAYNRTSRKKFIVALSKIFLLQDEDDIDNAKFQRDLVMYTVLNLGTVRYSVLEDVFLLVHSIDQTIRKRGLDLSELVEEFKEDKLSPNDLEAQRLLLMSQTLLIMICFRNYIVSSYGISQIQLDSFNPSRVDAELRQPPKIVRMDEFVLDTVALDNDLTSTETQVRLITTFFEQLEEVTN